jgi:hypothetical protein
MDHQDFTAVYEWNALLFRKSSQPFGDQVSYGGAGLGEQPGLTSLLVVDWDEASWIDGA